jgi:H+/Cl- antiporter ClcA
MKADTLSLTGFEAGLFGWMAIEHFFIFHADVKRDQPTYWFMMQIGMCLGFLTAYPMNWWLVKNGFKEAM